MSRAARLTLDEVQRAPAVLLAVKRAVDARRTRGRFVLTGSANPLLLEGVADSLAGRASYITLWPMTRREQQRMGRAGLWPELLAVPDTDWIDVLAGLDEPTGAHLENLVLCDLLAWRDASTSRADVCYWRTAAGAEVDLVIDTGSDLLPIEIKATARPRVADAGHLQAFRAEYGRHCRAGLLLHTGDAVEWLAPGILAAPWWRVL